jgi:hypothetical protein
MRKFRICIREEFEIDDSEEVNLTPKLIYNVDNAYNELTSELLWKRRERQHSYLHLVEILEDGREEELGRLTFRKRAGTHVSL